MRTVAFVIVMLLSGSMTADSREKLAPSLPPVPREGLVAFWTMDKTFASSAGTKLDADANQTTWTACRDNKKDRAVAFAGAKSLIHVKDNDVLDVDEAFSLSVWIRPASYTDASGRAGVIAEKWYYKDRDGSFDLLFNDSKGTLELWVCNSSDTYVEDSLAGKTKIPLNQWTHIAATFDRGVMKLYVNGKLDASATSQKVTRLGTKEYPRDDLIIGGTWKGHYCFKGSMDDFGLWERALSPAEVYGICKGIASSGGLLLDAKSALLVTADGELSLGQWNPQAVRFKAFNGKVLTIPPEKLQGVLRGKADQLDRLVLTEAETVVGQWLDESVAFQIDEKVQNIPVEKIAQIAMPRVAVPAGLRATLRLTNGSELTLIEAPDISLKGWPKLSSGYLLSVRAMPDGKTLEATFTNGSKLIGAPAGPIAVRTHLLGRLVVELDSLSELRAGNPPGRTDPPMTVSLSTGEIVHGTFATEGLAVKTDFGTLRPRAESIRKVSFNEEDPTRVTVVTADGSQLHGVLGGERLAVQILPGPVVHLPVKDIKLLTFTPPKPEKAHEKPDSPPVSPHDPPPLPPAVPQVMP